MSRDRHIDRDMKGPGIGEQTETRAKAEEMVRVREWNRAGSETEI